MSSLEPFHQRLRRRQTNERWRHEPFPGAVVPRTILDVPRRWSIYGKHRNLGGRECFDDFGERLANLATKWEAEDGVNDVICILQGAGEVFCERNLQIFELLL